MKPFFLPQRQRSADEPSHPNGLMFQRLHRPDLFLEDLLQEDDLQTESLQLNFFQLNVHYFLAQIFNT